MARGVSRLKAHVQQWTVQVSGRLGVRVKGALDARSAGLWEVVGASEPIDFGGYVFSLWCTGQQLDGCNHRLTSVAFGHSPAAPPGRVCVCQWMYGSGWGWGSAHGACIG
eukprot:360105-Chlamydomonas_euryale.AAC.6